MIVLSEADIQSLIASTDAVALAAEAYRLSAAGGASAAFRGNLTAQDPKRGCLLLAGSAGPARLSIKSNVHSHLDGPDAPRRWSSLLTLWDWQQARPRALISANLFNEHRTAAGFAAGIDKLAVADAASAALFGAGKSAPLTARYLKAVRPTLKRLFLMGRSVERLAALKGHLERDPAFADMELLLTATPAEAVAASEIVVTVTTSDAPVFPGAAARAGSCVVLGGANRPTAREADDTLIRRADIYVDSFDGIFGKAGDLSMAKASGTLDASRMRGEIGAFTDGPAPLSRGADVLVFKSMGLALQDVLLAEALVERALASGLGLTIDLTGAA